MIDGRETPPQSLRVFVPPPCSVFLRRKAEGSNKRSACGIVQMRLLPKFGLYRRGRLWYNNRVIGAVGSIEAVGCHGGCLENNSAFFASTLARGLSPWISHGFRMKGLPMVKKKILLLLAVIFVLALGISCYFFRGRNVYRISARGQEFKELLHLSECRLSSECYTWTCPSNNSVTVSNQTFKIYDPYNEGWRFMLNKQNGERMADCRIWTASSSEVALDVICSMVMNNCTAPTSYMADKFSVCRDSKGNVMLEHHKKICFLRTYGNLAVKIKLYSPVESLSAKDFAQALIEAGASRR